MIYKTENFFADHECPIILILHDENSANMIFRHWHPETIL